MNTKPTQTQNDLRFIKTRSPQTDSGLRTGDRGQWTVDRVYDD